MVVSSPAKLKNSTRLGVPECINPTENACKAARTCPNPSNLPMNLNLLTGMPNLYRVALFVSGGTFDDIHDALGCDRGRCRYSRYQWWSTVAVPIDEWSFTEALYGLQNTNMTA